MEFQIAEEGDPREVAWLIEAYDALGVPIESRRATAVDLFARVATREKRASPWAAWQPFALEHEPIGSSTWPAVAGTPSTGLIPDGWRVLRVIRRPRTRHKAPERQGPQTTRPPAKALGPPGGGRWRLLRKMRSADRPRGRLRPRSHPGPERVSRRIAPLLQSKRRRTPQGTTRAPSLELGLVRMSLFRRPPRRDEQPPATLRQQRWDELRRQQAATASGWAPDEYDANDWSWECLRLVGAVEQDMNARGAKTRSRDERVERARITLPPGMGSPVDHEVHGGRI